MSSKSNGQKQQKAAKLKEKRDQEQAIADKEKAEKEKAKEQKAKDEALQRANEKAERDKAKDAAPSSSFDSPSKRKAPKSREASPAKVSKEKPQAETADDQQGSSSQPMETQGSSVNLGQIDDDSDFVEGEDEDVDEDEDEDEDVVAEVKLPPAKNAAGKAKKDRGRQIKPTTPQGKFKLGQFKN